MFLLVPAYLVSPGPTAVKRLCVCVYPVLSGDFNFNHSDFLTLINYVSSV